MRDHEPSDGCRQRRQLFERLARVGIQAIAQITPGAGPGLRVVNRFIGQSLQPAFVIIVTDEGLEQPQRHPFVPVEVAFRELAAEALLERDAGFAEVVKQRRELGQQANILGGMPVVLVVASQYVAHSGVCRYCPFGVEAAGVADDPQQLAMVPATYPVTGHGGVLARRLAQQAPHGVEAGLGNRRLPCAVATAFRELVEDAARLFQCALVALGYQQDVHAEEPASSATRLIVSIMKSRDSLRVKLSMHARRNACSESPFTAERNA